MAKAFDGYDYVVALSGSCVAMVRDNYPRLGAARAAAEGRGNEPADQARSSRPAGSTSSPSSWSTCWV
jgi:L-lactate dehydrogenase complex protein LldE